VNPNEISRYERRLHEVSLIADGYTIRINKIIIDLDQFDLSEFSETILCDKLSRMRLEKESYIEERDRIQSLLEQNKKELEAELDKMINTKDEYENGIEEVSE